MMASAPVATGMLTVLLVAVAYLAPVVEGHGFLFHPVSRQYLLTREFNNNGEYDPDYVEKWAGSYNGGGSDAVQARTIANLDDDILEEYGGGDYWIVGAAWEKGERCANNNYLESSKIDVGHGVCGDPPQSGDPDLNTYSTDNSEWPVLETYTSGSIIEIKTIINNNHWGHIEFFLCDTADMDDPNGVVTQDCLNTHPLDRDDTDGYNSPIDPDYPGRFFVNPECRGKEGETDQSGRPELTGGGNGLDQGYVNTGRYHLPDIECTHCVLQMKYYAYVGCHHPGYDFMPDSDWPGDCAKDKELWLPHKNRSCLDEGRKWGNVFFGCADMALASDGESPPPAPESPAPVVPTTDAPVPTTDAPVPTTDAPVPSTDAPVPTTDAPVLTTEAPVPTIDEPVAPADVPVAMPIATTEPTVDPAPAPMQMTTTSAGQGCMGDAVEPYQECGDESCCSEGYVCVAMGENGCYWQCRPM